MNYGDREGVWTIWHENGQKKAEGAYKSNKREGVWTYWDDKGNVK
jgi:antitoxin component YwqK of YwqJK toxin-antitoxin module